MKGYRAPCTAYAEEIALEERKEGLDNGRGRLRERVKDVLRRIDTGFIERGSRSISDEDVQWVVEKADAIEHRLHRGGPLTRFLDDGRLLLALVKDYWQNEYREVPYWTLAAIAFALLYVLNPFDLIPDALPGIGLLDDAAVLSACLLLVEQDLHEYKAWRTRRE